MWDFIGKLLGWRGHTWVLEEGQNNIYIYNEWSQCVVTWPTTLSHKLQIKFLFFILIRDQSVTKEINRSKFVKLEFGMQPRMKLLHLRFCSPTFTWIWMDLNRAESLKGCMTVTISLLLCISPWYFIVIITLDSKDNQARL